MLYLTSNPESVEKTVEHPDGSIETDGVWLRVDFEVRQVKDLLKKSKYRDLVSIEHLPAATTMDNDEGTKDGDGLDFALLARLLGATDRSPPWMRATPPS